MQDVVAGEQHEVGPQRVAGADHLADVIQRQPGAVMHVGQLHQAQAVEGGRQAAQGDGRRVTPNQRGSTKA